MPAAGLRDGAGAGEKRRHHAIRHAGVGRRWREMRASEPSAAASAIRCSPSAVLVGTPSPIMRISPARARPRGLPRSEARLNQP